MLRNIAVLVSGRAARERGEPLSWLPIPVLTARTLGRFRALIGLLLFLVILDTLPSPQPLEMHRNYSWLADWSWLHLLASSELACRVLGVSTLVACAMFALGLWTRRVYVLLVGGVILSRLVDLQRVGTHDWDLPVLTLLALIVVPWGDGFSIDAWLTGADETRAGRRYGLAIWIPGLTIGLALLAAAYAKLANSGLAWVTTGAVKFHFVEDAGNTPFNLGLWVASQPTIAVLLSAGAILLEATFIGVTLIRSPWKRMLAGVVGLQLFVGFFVFQGVIWWPWLIFFTAFLPWPLLDNEAVRPSKIGRLRPLHAVVLALVVLQQAIASLTAGELEPIISSYPMYSGTFHSSEAFQRRLNRFQHLMFESSGVEIGDRVSAIQGASAELLEAAESIASGSVPNDGTVTTLRGVREEYEARFRTPLEEVTVIAERVSFDWEAGEFRHPVRIRIADVKMPALSEQSGRSLGGQADASAPVVKTNTGR